MLWITFASTVFIAIFILDNILYFFQKTFTLNGANVLHLVPFYFSSTISDSFECRNLWWIIYALNFIISYIGIGFFYSDWLYVLYINHMLFDLLYHLKLVTASYSVCFWKQNASFVSLNSVLMRNLITNCCPFECRTEYMVCIRLPCCFALVSLFGRWNVTRYHYCLQTMCSGHSSICQCERSI